MYLINENGTIREMTEEEVKEFCIEIVRIDKEVAE